MSKTLIDMPKVTQMLDAGWDVRIYKGPMGSYEVRALHSSNKKMESLRATLAKGMSENKNFLRETNMTAEEAVELMDFHDEALMTDDFTPEQALTRMAYKTFGEII
jgi:hypothetical protein